jgi:hypothetical protein
MRSSSGLGPRRTFNSTVPTPSTRVPAIFVGARLYVRKEERFFAQCIVPDGVRSHVKHLLLLLLLSLFEVEVEERRFGVW